MSREKIEKLRDKYQEKADYYWDCYQFDGQASQLRAHERNLMLADALTDVLNVQPIKDELTMLKLCVMELRPDDERGDLALNVKRLQRRVSDGKIL